MRTPAAVLPALLPALLLVATGCASADRTGEIVETLTRADRGLIEDRPALVQAKYEKMGETGYNFVRGTMPLYLHDLEKREHALARLPHEVILSNGDPHPENLGTFGGASGVLVDWNDYDSAGPLTAARDLIRIGYSLAIFVEETTGEDPDPAIDALLDGYHGDESGDGGLFIAKLVERALEKGDERDELDDLVDGPSGLVFERDGEELVDPDPAFAAELQQAVPAYAPTRAAGAPALGVLRDVVQVKGKGVTSVPLDRYQLLVATADGTDHRVLEMKEAWDPALDEELRVIGSQPFVAQRIVETSRAVGMGPAMDVDLGIVLAGGKAFVVKGASGYTQDLDYDRVKEKYEEGDYSPDDLVTLGRWIGGTLAAMHHRGGATGTFLEERDYARELIRSFAARARKDHALFVERLAEGPIVEPK